MLLSHSLAWRKCLEAEALLSVILSVQLLLFKYISSWSDLLFWGMLNFFNFFVSIEVIRWFYPSFFCQYKNVIYIFWLTYIESSLYYWDEINLIKVSDLFLVLLKSIYQSVVENFCIYIHQGDIFIVFYFCHIHFWFW